MNKEEIIKLIQDTNIPYHELPKKVPIKEFVGVSESADTKITYGVNVSLGGEIDIPVIPFNYNSNGFNAQRIAEKVTSGYTIPDFLNQFNLQEILFRVDFIKESSIIKINKILIKIQIGKKSLTSDEIKSEFFDKNPSTFLHENILALFHSHYSPFEVKVNVWVRGVDPDVTTGNFLEHFLVISDDPNIYEKSIKPTIAQNFLELVTILKSRLLYDAKIKQRKESIKSAKAAIMARNMSHNLGSHVMSYLKLHLGSVSNILRDHVLSTLLESDDLDSLKNLSVDDSNKLTLPFLVGLGRFISYLQERQDYIATVSTNHIPYCSSVNFKDFIYDELNSDKRYERHPDRTNLKPDNILLGNIARSEGLGRQTSPTKTQASQTEGESSLRDIVLKFRTSFDGSPVPEIKPNDKNTNDPKLIAARELEDMRQYDLSLPGGIVGRQAIFSIVENIIRNAAKHGNWREQGKLELTIDIFTKEDVEIDQPDDDLKKRLLDNDKPDVDSLSLKDVFKKFYCGKGSNDYYIITLTDNLVSDPNLLEELRKALHEDYVKLDNQMIETNKGIKEMRISAAWLRRCMDNDLELSPFNVSNDGKGKLIWDNAESKWDKQPPILYVRLSKDIHNQCHLQYIFCVLRPKKVAFVSSSFANQNQNTNNLGGYYFLSPNEYIDVPNKNFEFVVYDDEILNTYENNSKKYKKAPSKPESDIKNPPNTNIYTHLFEIEKERYVKARCQSSQRFIILSNLSKEKNNIKEIKTLVLDINGIKNQIENSNKRIEELTEEVYKSLIKELNERLTEKTEELKRKTEEVYFHLYQHLSKWDEKDKILIKDNNNNNILYIYDDEKKTLLEVEEKPLSSNILTYNPDDKNIKYRYIKHLEEKVEFEKYVIKDNKQYDFSEGITGDNSTDRLVRKEPKTELWFFKQLHAMKQQVAVIDERIFSKVTGLDESDFVTPENSWGKDLEADKRSLKALNELSEDEVEDINLFDTHEQLEEYIKNMNLKKANVKIKRNLNSVDAQNHLGATYQCKNLHILSLIQNIEKPNNFILYGISIDKGKPAFSQCVRYATFRWDSDNKRLRIENDSQYQVDWMKFDSLSIHQGLLDKMYNAFGIKKDDDDIVAKENLTKDFYEHFIINAPAQEIVFKDNNGKQRYFLPGMTIHSGRSKPSKEDMPQQLPFIPYSAIEHAVLDCKYSIVELLYSARHE